MFTPTICSNEEIAWLDERWNRLGVLDDAVSEDECAHAGPFENKKIPPVCGGIKSRWAAIPPPELPGSGSRVEHWAAKKQRVFLSAWRHQAPRAGDNLLM
jgi:hypothetical protein